MRPGTINKIMERSAQRGVARYLLSTILGYVDNNGVAWPGITTLAHKLNVSERTIHRLLNQLAASSEIIIESGGGRHITNHYRIGAKLLNPDRPVTVSKAVIPDNSVTVSSVQHPDISGQETLTNLVRNPDNVVTPFLLISKRELVREDAGSAHPLKVRKRSKQGQLDKQPWPEGFTLSPPMRELATKRGVANVELEFEKFRNHAGTIGRKCAGMRGWLAAWRNWCINAVEFAAQRAKPQPVPPVRRLQTGAELDAARMARRAAHGLN
jgi:hypothetical protein